MTNLKDYDVVVFDLDDTLYSEIDYVISGYRYLSELITKLYSKDTYQTFIEALEQNEPDVFSYVLAEHELPSLLKDHLIFAYRYHSPDIKLSEGVLVTLKELSLRNVPMYLITDGRSITQRLKILALGIDGFFESIFISEEVGVGKPNPDSFLAIQNTHPDQSIVYVADNPKKDFIAPKQLGWGSIGIFNMHNRVHSLIDDYQDEADCWLESFKEIKI